MNTESKQEFYVSPQVEVYEINARQVVCASNQDAQNSGYGSTDYEW